jgi:hypothetical protein
MEQKLGRKAKLSTYLGHSREAAVEVVLVHPGQQAADIEGAWLVGCRGLLRRRRLGQRQRRAVVVVGWRIGPGQSRRRRHGTHTQGRMKPQGGTLRSSAAVAAAPFHRRKEKNDVMAWRVMVGPTKASRDPMHFLISIQNLHFYKELVV